MSPSAPTTALRSKSTPFAKAKKLAAQSNHASPIPRTAAMLSTDTKNVGDENSNPALYFSFGRDVVKPDWPTIRKKFVAENLVLGGGYLSRMFDDDEKYFDIADEVKRVFVWGIGHDPRKPLLKRTLDRCTLVGIREFGHQEIDNKKVFYVPCASCMSPLFDIKWTAKNEYVFFLHSHSSTITDRLKIDAPVMINRQDFVSTIRFVASGKVVVTNSYHGAYYATLLGRKAVVVAEPGQWDTFRPEKFEMFKYPPSFAPAEDWRSVVPSTKTYPKALADSRKTNIAFYERVLKAMSDD